MCLLSGNVNNIDIIIYHTCSIMQKCVLIVIELLTSKYLFLQAKEAQGEDKTVPDKVVTNLEGFTKEDIQV